MPFVIFSGLPCSGKSTLAGQLGPALGLPILDKDDVLDTLFDERGVGDLAWRAALRREADRRFTAAAQMLAGACLVSWWCHPNASATASGTSTDWLRMLPGPIVEVHCQCDVEVALRRFVARKRHSGHLDSMRAPATLGEQFHSAVSSPLGCGALISVATDEPIDIASLIDRLRDALTA
jgi:hypothetical protein